MGKKKFRNKCRLNSIQRLLSLILILTTTVIFAGFGVYNYFITKSVLNTELHRLNDFWADQLSKMLKLPLWTMNSEGVEEIINSTMLEKQIYSVRVKDIEGNIFGKMRDNNWNPIEINEEFTGDYMKSENIASGHEILGTVEVCLSPKFMQEKLGRETVNTVMITIFLNISLGFVLFVSVRKSIILPVTRLAESVRIIASGHFGRSVHSQREDEIGQLASDIDKMRLAIRDLTENMKEQERLKKEMEIARKIQTSLLPILPDRLHPDFKIAAAMLPAEQVGGDFYDISFDRSGNLWFAIGDVSGHGVTPGLIMMMAQTVHTTVTSNFDCDARSAVVKINEILYKNVHERLNESHFMTFTALRYLGGGQLQHAGAHLSMIICRQKTGVCELVRTRGVYLNFKKDISKATKNAEFSLEHGDVLVLYTDGLTEAENPDGKMLDIDGFVKIVEKHAHQEPVAMKEMIMADVIRWCGNRRGDDMTIVIIKRVTEH